MSTTSKAVEHHRSAAIHFEIAARHNSQAADQLDAGHHERAAHHAHIAYAHAVIAEHDTAKASEEYAHQFRGGDAEAA